MTAPNAKPRAGEHTPGQSTKEKPMDENPYLLHGDELARTEKAAKQRTALNPKAAWPFPQSRAELEAERDQLREQNKELVEALRPFAEPEFSQQLNEGDLPGNSVVYVAHSVGLTIGHFRRARAVLAKVKP